jgi:integrase
MRQLWKAWDELEVPMREYFRLLLLTGQRGQEVRDMRWQDCDVASGWWTIPSRSAKNKQTHRVYLGASAGSIVAARLAVADKDDVFVLAGARGRRQIYEAVADFGVENFEPHDLRRTMASVMASGGVARFLVGRVLNHIEHGVTKVYDRYGYDAEKRSAWTWWDAKLKSILDPKAVTLLPFTKVG